MLCSMRMGLQWKGTQHAIEGFAKSAAQNPRARLVLLSWGSDLATAREQLKIYEILDRTLFIPTVGKKRLISYLRACDVLIEQFVLGYYGGSALGGMACGMPVINQLEKLQYDALIDVGAPPTLDAASGDDVAAHQEALRADPDYATGLGRKTQKWILAVQTSRCWHLATRLLLAGAAIAIKLLCWGSRLNLPRSRKENRYNHFQLSTALISPNYSEL